MEIRKDVLGREPMIGDTISWNPPLYKGLVYGEVVDFRKENGLPIVKIDNVFEGKYVGQSSTHKGQTIYVPKTGFVIAKRDTSND